MEFQQPHRHMRPPPPHPHPPAADHHHLHQPPQHPRPPLPPSSAPFYSGQFQYQHSPPPPPIPASQSHHFRQWSAPPPPPPPHLPDPSTFFPPPSHSSYPVHPPPGHPYGAPAPHPPRPLMTPPVPYPPVQQDWGNVNWGHHQCWDYPAHSSEEVWAAKARAWAAAQASSDNQHPQSHFTTGRPEEQNQYYEQHQQTSVSASTYDQNPASGAPHQRTTLGQLQESASINSGHFSYVSGQNFDNNAGDGTLAGDSNAASAHQQGSSASLVVHQPEVPSSYSSVAGKEQSGHQDESFHKSYPLPVSSTLQQNMRPPPPTVSGSISMEQSYYGSGNQSADFSTDPSDLPLDFAPRVGPGFDSHIQTTYAHESGGALAGFDPVSTMPPTQSWTSPTPPGVVYPSVPPVFPSGQQVDPSIPLASSVTGHAAHLIGRMPGPTFHQPMPLGGTSYGINAGPAGLSTAFPADAYGASGVPDRPKKASVPNWLREEIIKSKAAIANSAVEHSKAGTSLEDNGLGKSLEKDDSADNKSIDSSRSAEDEAEDEDEVEAARTAAINQEIKRVLTEVLLKVTDELFDEIATKVLDEEDTTVEVNQNDADPNHIVPSSSPTVLTPKTSAVRVVIPSRASKTDNDDVGDNSSGFPGDVLGLASYASEDEEDNNIQGSSELNSNENILNQKPIMNEGYGNAHGAENGHAQADNRNNAHLKNGSDSKPIDGAKVNCSNKTIAKDETKGNDKKIINGDAIMSNNFVEEKFIMKSELTVGNSNTKKIVIDDFYGRQTSNKAEKNEREEIKRSFADKERKNLKKDESRSRQEDKHVRKEKTDCQNGSKEGAKEDSSKFGEKAMESDSRKKSPKSMRKEYKKDVERERGSSGKEVDDRKKDRSKDEKREKSRRKPSDLSRNRRRRSSSVGRRSKHSKDHVEYSDADDLTGESSEDCRSRRQHMRKRNLSPSPVGSRRRQVSRSPHSKHSQRRHSPYSSLETTRGHRSRSRSPTRRKR